MFTAVLPLVPLLSFFSALVTAALVVTLWRRGDKPGARMFVAVMLGASLWSVFYALSLYATDPGLSRTFASLAWIGRILMPMSWFLFALQYTGRGDVVTRPLIGFLAINPGLTLAILATGDAQRLMWQDYHVVRVAGIAVASYGNGPWLVWQAVYGYALIGAGLLILVDTQYSQSDLYRGQALALVVAAAVPSIANVAWLFKLSPVPSLDLTPSVFSISGVLFVYALFRQDLFGLVPATHREGQQVALDYFEDGIVMIDDANRVIDVNATAERILQCEADAVLGQPIDSVVSDTSFTHTHSEDLLEIDGQKYELTATPILGQGDRVVGQTLVFHDVTERVRRKQLLSVLNRVLRHNLRNEMTVIRGYAELLEGRLEGPDAEFVSLIDERSDRLLELSEKARELERVIASDERRTTTFSLGERVRDVARRVADRYPASQIDVEVPPGLTMVGDPGVIETVVENVVENAVVHSDVDRPAVFVTVADAPDSIVLTVADDGPGIPEQELAILEADEETPLDHGSGLGLWLVTWSVTALGGTIEFDSNEPRGTVVRIRFPRTGSTSTVFGTLVT